MVRRKTTRIIYYLYLYKRIWFIYKTPKKRFEKLKCVLNACLRLKYKTQTNKTENMHLKLKKKKSKTIT